MRISLTLLAALLPLALGETDTFKADVVAGKVELSCSFTMIYTKTKVDIKKSKGKCNKSKKGAKVNGVEVTSKSGVVYTMTMSVAKNGAVKFQKVSMALGRLC